jgi:tetratricopeptide (TPR) repeat protein
VNTDIRDLLDDAYDTDDPEETLALAEAALEIDPDNPEALMLKADSIDEDEARLPLLERALESAQDGGDSSVYLAALQRLAYTLFILEEDDRAMEAAEELMRLDTDDDANGRALYYRILLEREEWQRVLDSARGDEIESLGQAYAVAAASFMLDSSSPHLLQLLWRAIEMSPNVPFYMLGYMPDPVDDSEDEEDAFHFGLLFETVWSASRELLNWFSRATILFGLLTGRFGDENGAEAKDMREILIALGGDSDYEHVKAHIAAEHVDDEQVLSLLESIEG